MKKREKSLLFILSFLIIVFFLTLIFTFNYSDSLFAYIQPKKTGASSKTDWSKTALEKNIKNCNDWIFFCKTQMLKKNIECFRSEEKKRCLYQNMTDFEDCKKNCPVKK